MYNSNIIPTKNRTNFNFKYTLGYAPARHPPLYRQFGFFFFYRWLRNHGRKPGTNTTGTRNKFRNDTHNNIIIISCAPTRNMIRILNRLWEKTIDSHYYTFKILYEFKSYRIRAYRHGCKFEGTDSPLKCTHRKISPLTKYTQILYSYTRDMGQGCHKITR